ncbi:MAG: hypothetical protein ACOYNS_17415 [Bacteroidota bacterium]
MEKTPILSPRILLSLQEEIDPDGTSIQHMLGRKLKRYDPKKY